MKGNIIRDGPGRPDDERQKWRPLELASNDLFQLGFRVERIIEAKMSQILCMYGTPRIRSRPATNRVHVARLQ